MFQLSIPIYPHVKKYLAIAYNIKDGYQLSSTDPIGSYLINVLEPYPLKSKASYNNCSCLNINISPTYGKNKAYLSDQKIKQFNKFIAMLIKYDMCRFVENSTLPKDYAITDFLAIYEFEEEEISFKTAQLQYYRHKKGTEQCL